jgi:hypothetical protein
VRFRDRRIDSRKKLEKMEAQLRKLGINPDDGSPLPPEPGSDGLKAP